MAIRVIINDTSCLIDLRKAELLTDLLRLPYRFQVALPVVQDELTDFSAAEWRVLERRGLHVIDLTGEQITQAIRLKTSYPGLSSHDCFSLVLAQTTKDAMLLTGDRQLRARAKAAGVAVHGVLWVSDELERCDITPRAALAEALSLLQGDPLVHLPQAPLAERIARLTKRRR